MGVWGCPVKGRSRWPSRVWKPDTRSSRDVTFWVRPASWASSIIPTSFDWRESSPDVSIYIRITLTHATSIAGNSLYPLCFPHRDNWPYNLIFNKNKIAWIMNIHLNKYVWQCLYLCFPVLLLQNTNVLWQYAFGFAFIAMNYHTSWWDIVFKKVIDNTSSWRDSVIFLRKINELEAINSHCFVCFMKAFMGCISSDCLYRHYWESNIDARCSRFIMRMLIIICHLIENAVAIVCFRAPIVCV